MYIYREVFTPKISLKFLINTSLRTFAQPRIHFSTAYLFSNWICCSSKIKTAQRPRILQCFLAFDVICTITMALNVCFPLVRTADIV